MALISKLYARRGVAWLTPQFERSQKIAWLVYGFASLLLLIAGVLAFFGAGAPAVGDAAENVLRLAAAGYVSVVALVTQMALLLSAGIRRSLGVEADDRRKSAADGHRRAQWLIDDEEIY